MFAEIITIGDEILIGQIVDSNSAFISKQLNKIGIDVYQITSISDQPDRIINALDNAAKNSKVVILTGGLGPTNDDVTKHTLCAYFEDQLVENNTVLKHIEILFEKYVPTPISDVNRQQALVPTKAEVLMNAYGTAPGMWFEKNGTVFISMPGVPFEMKTIMTSHVIPKLKERFERPYIVHKTVLTYGFGESVIAAKIETWEASLPAFIKLAYLPNLGRVRLRLSGRGDDIKRITSTIDHKIEQLHKILGDIIVGYEEDDGAIENKIANILIKNKKTLAVAESCTGGRIGNVFTALEGASAYFKGGIVAYATASKIDVLKVNKTLIDTYSVTSAAVVEEMALKAKACFGSDYAISTTGNAGPTKGDGNVPIGTVYIGIATPDHVYSKKFTFSNHRARTIGKAVNKSLEMFLKEIL